MVTKGGGIGIRGRVKIVQPAHVRMRDGSRGIHLVLQHCHSRSIPDEPRVQSFDGYKYRLLMIERAVNLAQSSCAQEPNYLETPIQFTARFQRVRYANAWTRQPTWLEQIRPLIRGCGQKIVNKVI
jgi:hypothetical protein